MLPNTSKSSGNKVERYVGNQNRPSISNSLPRSAIASTVVKVFDDSSGSDDDLGLEAKRILRARKKEREQIESLGPLVPIDTDCSNLPLSFTDGTGNVEALQ